jgi:hypothetical protein
LDVVYAISSRANMHSVASSPAIKTYTFENMKNGELSLWSEGGLFVYRTNKAVVLRGAALSWLDHRGAATLWLSIRQNDFTAKLRRAYGWSSQGFLEVRAALDMRRTF